MNDTLIQILSVLLFLSIGGILGYFFAHLKFKSLSSQLEERLLQSSKTIGDLESDIIKTEEAMQRLQEEKEQLTIQFTKQESDFNHLKTRNDEYKAEVERLQEHFKKEFENLANKILDEKSNKFTNQNKENLDAILKPLQEKIHRFEKRVEETNKESIDRSAQLRQQIIGLKELNEKITKEASNLTKALKGDTKTQGNWGEMVLERVLERSGLGKDSEYFVQQSFTTEAGKRLQPDVVIHLPGDKRMVVDSKVSLNAYERYVNANDADDKKQHLKNHVLAIKTHVKQLGEKNYHTMYDMESPDFVLLFIPIESAFALASIEYPSLYSDAFEKNIIIVTPTTLLAVLKTIDSMWQNEKQKANALEIATQAGRLYDSFVNLTDELKKVGKQIDTVKGTYTTAMVKLTGRGNLVTRVENLKKLGAKASKSIDDKLLKRANELNE